MLLRGYVTTSWGQVHYRRAGESGPALVLLHESPLSSLVYEAALGFLSERFRAVAFDTPGYGSSDGPPRQAGIPQYASTLLEAVDGLGFDRFAVAGVHTGASLALQLALQAGPTRATHVILSGVPLMSAESRAEYLASWAPPIEPEADGSHFRWAWARYQRIWKGPPELLHTGATLLLSNLDRYSWAYNAAFRYDPEADLRKLLSPTLFLTAEDDLLSDGDRQAVILVPRSQLVSVPGLPGQLPMRVPEQYAAAITSFVQA